MANDARDRVCPVEKADSLDTRLRRWMQNPKRIVGPFVQRGMTVLDIGCGPGFFTIDMARMVGETGRVIAADLQEGMLRKVEDKIQGTTLRERVVLHQCEEDKVGVSEPIDFALAFYVVHEVPDQEALFREIAGVLKPGGKLLIVEPPFHVSKEAFERTLGNAQGAGLRLDKRPRILFNKAALLEKV